MIKKTEQKYEVKICWHIVMLRKHLIKYVTKKNSEYGLLDNEVKWGEKNYF